MLFCIKPIVILLVILLKLILTSFKLTNFYNKTKFSDITAIVNTVIKKILIWVAKKATHISC